MSVCFSGDERASVWDESSGVVRSAKLSSPIRGEWVVAELPSRQRTATLKAKRQEGIPPGNLVVINGMVAVQGTTAVCVGELLRR